jgi:hypothetical protein
MSRFEFFLRVFVLLLAVSGWAAFAGVYSRLHDTEDQLRDVTKAYSAAGRQNEEMGENFLKVQRSHESLVRMQNQKIKELESKIGTYELRLRQLGIIQE